MPSDRIVGGHETTIEEHPWQVSLQYASSHRCGGSIIGQKWIITAAHCTVNLPVQVLAVRVGSSKHASGGTVIEIKNYVNHPKYNEATLDYDISVLELENEIGFNDKIRSIKLPNGDLNLYDGTMCQISGWGKNKNSMLNSKYGRLNFMVKSNRNHTKFTRIERITSCSRNSNC